MQFDLRLLFLLLSVAAIICAILQWDLSLHATALVMWLTLWSVFAWLVYRST